MKQPLLSTIFVFALFQIQAQVTLSIKPDLVMMDVDHREFETVAHSFITNKDTAAVTIRWIRQVESISPGWHSAICDVNACYSVEVDTTPSDFLLTLPPGDSSMLDVHIRPFGVEGAAKLKVLIEEVGNPDNSVTAEYIFNQVSSSRNVSSGRESISLYPNPATDYFMIKGNEKIKQMVIYSLTGQEIRRYSVYSQSRYDVSDLQRGIYLVRLFNSKNDVIKSLRLNKK